MNSAKITGCQGKQNIVTNESMQTKPAFVTELPNTFGGKIK
jgi:hypothetical protein